MISIFYSLLCEVKTSIDIISLMVEKYLIFQSKVSIQSITEHMI